MIERTLSNGRMSQIVIHGDTIYLAGQVADDTTQSVEGQTSQVMAKIDRLLESAGSDKTKILSATVWLSDIRTFDEMNMVWDKWVVRGNEPARATLQSGIASPVHLVEIGIIAAR